MNTESVIDREARSAAVIDRRSRVGDRRHEGRLPFVAAVLQRTPHSAQPLLGQAANLGKSGMLLRRCRAPGEAPLVADTRVRVSFELPDGGSLLDLEAEVVFERPHNHHFTTGLRFCALPEAARARIERFVAAARAAGRADR